MKAMSQTMIIIVTIVVVLVAALVLLTVFGDQLAKIAEGQCISQKTAECKTLCITEGKTSGSPDNWKLIGGCTINGKEKTVECSCATTNDN